MMETIAKLLIVAVIWFVMASPLLVLSFFIAKRLHKKSKNLFMNAIGVSFITALLVAPVPTPIITFFVPFIAWIIQLQPYSEFYAPIWHVAAVSFAISWIVSFLISSHYFNSSNG
jgi:hypothetical protein